MGNDKGPGDIGPGDIEPGSGSGSPDDPFKGTPLEGMFGGGFGGAGFGGAGMPDLIQFYPAERGYRMIEVKGPGDRLQDNQKRWLAFCAEHGMPVEVCYVTWAGEPAA